MRFPILDIRLWRRDPHAFAAELRHACHHIGFFQVRHDVPPLLVKKASALSRAFFALPDHEKKSMSYEQSAQFRGYMSNGVENTAGKPDLREQVEIAQEATPAAATAMPPHRRLAGWNQWPDAALPELQPTIMEYAACMGQLADELTEALSLSIGLERGSLSKLFLPAPHWQLKLASYTPAPEAAATSTAEAPIGVGAHTDSGFLTLLLQDGSGGLQAFAQGEWQDVPPAGEEVVVCNLGEVAEMLSGGYLLATPHRVLLPPARRLSIPYFHNPQLDAQIEVLQLPSELPWEREADYDTKRHWRRGSNAFIDSYGLNAFKSLARSHPKVFARHHPDLEVTSDGRVVPREV